MTLLEEMVIDRVDLCDEGANSEAFVELFKRKETPMDKDLNKNLPNEEKPAEAPATEKPAEETPAAEKPAEEKVLTDAEKIFSLEAELAEARAELAEAKAKVEALSGLAGANTGCPTEKAEDKPNTLSFDSTETIKSLPPEIKEYIDTIKAQKEAAETALAKSMEEAKEKEAIEKANTFKAIPLAQEKLVGIIKSASPEVMELLNAVNTAMEGQVLSEVGKSVTTDVPATNEAWAKIESKANALAIEKKVSVAKAISQVIDENPELYREYIEGGAN